MIKRASIGYLPFSRFSFHFSFPSCLSFLPFLYQQPKRNHNININKIIITTRNTSINFLVVKLCVYQVVYVMFEEHKSSGIVIQVKELHKPSLNFSTLVASIHQLAFEFLPRLQFYKMRCNIRLTVIANNHLQ